MPWLRTNRDNSSAVLSRLTPGGPIRNQEHLAAVGAGVDRLAARAGTAQIDRLADQVHAAQSAGGLFRVRGPGEVSREPLEPLMGFLLVAGELLGHGELKNDVRSVV